MQFKAVFIYCVITLHFSGALYTHHQDYTKLQLQPLVQVVVTTVFSTPEDGCREHPIKVE
jgi:hypothetical protein